MMTFGFIERLVSLLWNFKNENKISFLTFLLFINTFFKNSESNTPFYSLGTWKNSNFLMIFTDSLLLLLLHPLVCLLFNFKLENDIFSQIFSIHKCFLQKSFIGSTWNLEIQILWYFLHISASFHLYQLSSSTVI